MSSGGVDPKLIESIPSALLKTIPAEQPPSDIVPNFMHPTTRVPVVLGIGGAFLVLAVVCFSIRIYTRIKVVKNWRWDDLTCSLGFMCSIVYFCVVVNGCLHGATGRHQWELYLSDALSEANLVQSYVTVIMVTPALGLIKFSLFIQYYLLFSLMRWVRLSVWIGGTISAVFYITVTITGFVLNSPWHGESLLSTILSLHYAKFAQFSIPTGVIGMLVDWYLFILPIPAVLALQMSTSKKLGVLIIFMTGGLAAIASIVSLYYRVKLQNDPTDPTWKVGYVLLWAQIEMFAGVAASSMPTVHQFFSRWNFSLSAWMLSMKSGLAHLAIPSRRKKTRVSSNEPLSFTSRDHGGSKSKKHEAIPINNLHTDRDIKNMERTINGRVGDSQIHLTHEFSITEHQLTL